jgi:hypothetical protein
MSSIIEFSIADRPITESDTDKLHAKAFRDLEEKICNLYRWAELRRPLGWRMRL